jgi:Leucine-rich repeat (LRR) protein
MLRRIKEWSSKSKEADPQSTSSRRGRYIHDQIILDLARQKIGARQGKQIAEELATNTTLWSLDLSTNHMGDRVVVAIADALKTNNSLRTIKLCFNDIGDVGMKALGESLTLNNSLTELHLSGNEIGTVGMTSLADGLKVNSGLKTLWLSYCSIDDQGLAILADALRSNTRLTELFLLSNQFGDEGAKSMLDVLFMHNTTLTRLYLDMNAVSQPVLSIVKEITKSNSDGTRAIVHPVGSRPIALPNPPNSAASSWQHGKSSKPGRARTPRFQLRNDSKQARRFLDHAADFSF